MSADRYLIWVDTGRACFGLVVSDELVVTRAPPIARYTVGWPAARAKGYLRGRGFEVQVRDASASVSVVDEAGLPDLGFLG